MSMSLSLGMNTAAAAITNMKKSAVLYHYPCPDGVFAALAAHIYFSASSTPPLYFPNTVYSPITPDQLPIHEIDDLYLLDFVGPSGFLQQISSRVSRVIVLDHHKTALEMVSADAWVNKDNVFKILDMERSGATIAYDYFKEMLAGNPRVAELERIRRIFEYIEDGDLWRWNLPNSKAFSSGLKDSNIEFNVNLNPSLFQQLLSLDLESVISQGMLSLSHKQNLIDGVLQESYKITLGGGEFENCLAVNADSIPELRSELGNQLAEKSQKMNLRGIGAVVYGVPELGNNQLLKVSLRSVRKEDTTPISQKFGGGGHRNASSFMISCSEFEKWKIL